VCQCNELLAGLYREKMEVTGLIHMHGVEEDVASAIRLKKNGYRVLKIKLTSLALMSSSVLAASGAAKAPTASQLPPQEAVVHNRYTSDEDVARGKRLFDGRCAPCHGLAGEGGRGATLARPRLVRAPDDAGLFKVIRNGIPQTEMPGAFDMIDREIWQVVAYVRTLGRTAVERVSGDPSAGDRLYHTKGGCPQCHTVNSEGGRMGPPLTEVARVGVRLTCAMCCSSPQLNSRKASCKSRWLRTTGSG